MKVEINIKEGKITAKTTFNTLFISKAKKLSGNWESPFWTFPIEAEQEVRALCMECYGDEGYGVVDTVSVRLEATCQIERVRGPVTLAGRVLASARQRDFGTKLGDDVLLVEGKLASGGSMKFWKTIVREGAILRVLGVARSLLPSYEAEAEELGFALFVEEPDAANRQRLLSQRESLQAQIEKIQRLLDGTDEVPD